MDLITLTEKSVFLNNAITEDALTGGALIDLIALTESVTDTFTEGDSVDTVKGTPVKNTDLKDIIIEVSKS